jgi:hypothetical protein
MCIKLNEKFAELLQEYREIAGKVEFVDEEKPRQNV